MRKDPKPQGSRRGRYIGFGLLAFILLCFIAVGYNRVHTVSGSGESYEQVCKNL